MKTVGIVISIVLPLIAAFGFVGSAIYLFSLALADPSMFVAAIAFTVIVGAMMTVVLSIIAHATLGMGLRELTQHCRPLLAGWQSRRLPWLWAYRGAKSMF